MSAKNKQINIAEIKTAEYCPYCQSKDFVKRGLRKNKYGSVQLYLCGNPDCGRTFTAQDVKGKKFPLNLVIEGMNLYNLGFNFDQTCKLLRQKFNVAPDTQTLAAWIEQYKNLCRYERLRPYATKMYKPAETVEVTTLAHRQLYRFRYHRAKTALMLQEFPNRRFTPLKEYLDNISSETPHQYFQEGFRMSEAKTKFDKADMIVKGKFNYANRLAGFVLQAVPDNKQRHEAVQRFMLANDSVTVATEVPVYIRGEDIQHLGNELGFDLQGIEKYRRKDGRILLTGHIDLVQVRNGQIHLLDYKPKAEKEKPVEQLTWYALAMSRLTGLRLFEFKCAWFDENDYFEFYPLHVVKKIRAKRTRRVRFKEGTDAVIPKKDVLTIVEGKYKKYERALAEANSSSLSLRARRKVGGSNPKLQ